MSEGRRRQREDRIPPPITPGRSVSRPPPPNGVCLEWRFLKGRVLVGGVEWIEETQEEGVGNPDSFHRNLRVLPVVTPSSVPLLVPGVLDGFTLPDPVGRFTSRVGLPTVPRSTVHYTVLLLP